MPEQPEVTDLKLAYINGQEHGGAPVFKDVRLTRDSNKLCEQLIDLATAHDKRIRSESELEATLEVEVQVRKCMAKLEELKTSERIPWNKILSQITTAITGAYNHLQMANNKLKGRIETWREEIEAGRQRERERLLEEARRAELKAEYDSDPVKKRQARVQAKQLQEEAKKHEPKPAKGMDTIEVYQFTIMNRQLAAKLPDEAITMEINEKWFNDRIREAKETKQPVPTFPGIEITVQTRVRIHR